MEDYRKYSKSNGDVSLIEADIQLIEKKFNIEITAELEMDIYGIKPVIKITNK